MILHQKKMDFDIIWLIHAGILGICLAYLKLNGKNPAVYVLPGFFLIMLLSGCALLLLSFLVTEGKILYHMRKKPNHPADCIIVLGCQVKKRVPSSALKSRLDTTLLYLSQYPDTKLFLSGGQGKGEEISEARCMYEYLTEHGVCKEQLILEDKSTTTKENLLYCRELIACREDPKSLRIALVSSNFHIYRAVRLAKKLGFERISGIAAPTDRRYLLHYMVREYFAVIKGYCNSFEKNKTI